ncbi:MAG: ABC transporter ATP-binding protein [Candidatus Liptonbacteria bacterium]|nr:ABC transporter ATP-binding protein [Candidatus Liptonbacteria bacterium]
MPNIPLEIKNLEKQFGGVHALDRVSLKIMPGTISGIVGPNGSGKSTLINLLSGLLPFDGGRVLIGGRELNRIIPHKAPSYGITRTFQNIRLFEQLPVLDNILFALTDRGVFGALFEKHGASHLAQAEEVLKMVGLWEKRNELAINLSYGQRKLLEIGRVYAMKSEVFLFDEPFAGLFPAMVETVAEVFRTLKAQGKTIILVEHDMGLIRKLTDYVFVLDSGELLAEGKPNDVLSKKEVIEAYLGE